MQRIFGILLTGSFFCAAGCFGIYLGHCYLAAESGHAGSTADRPETPAAADAAALRAAAPPRLLPVPSAAAIADPSLQPTSHQMAAALSTGLAGEAGALRFTKVNGKSVKDGPMVIAVPAGKFKNNQTELTIRLEGVDHTKKYRVKREGGEFLTEELAGTAADQEILLKPIAVPPKPDEQLVLQIVQDDTDTPVKLPIHLVRPLQGGIWTSGSTATGEFAAEIVAPGPTLNLKITGPVGAILKVKSQPGEKPDPDIPAAPLKNEPATITGLYPGVYEFEATVTVNDQTLTLEPLPVTIKPDPKQLGEVPQIVLIEQEFAGRKLHTGDPLLSSDVRLGGSALALQVQATVSRNLIIRERIDAREFSTHSAQPAKTDNSDTPVTLPVSSLSAGRHALEAVDLWSNQASRPVTVVVPDEAALAAPVITQRASGKYTDLQALAEPVLSYDGYLRLHGVQHPNPGTLEFLVFEKKDGENTFIQLAQPGGRAERVAGSEDWGAELTLPEFRRGSAGSHDGIILAVATRSGARHRFSVPLNVTYAPNTILEEGPPELAKAGQDGTQTAFKGADGFQATLENGVWRVNRSAFSLTGTGAPATAGQIAVLDARGEVVLAHADFPAGDGTEAGTWNVGLRELSDGRHRFVLAFARGDRISRKRMSLEILVRQRGPRIVGVIPPNFGTAPGVQKLTIQFNPENPLDAGPATREENFRLRGSNGSGVFNRGNEPIIVPSDAQYDPVDNAVTLTFAGTGENVLRPDIYQLIVNGSRSQVLNADAVMTDVAAIRDIFGNPLEGQEGHRGTDYVHVMSKPAGLAVDGEAPLGERRGIVGETGPYVPYPEFTEPRSVPDGFNPSDKVITRVARLYYFRDAHRVAQIINRNVKSYNRQAVDQQQQLADTAGRQAELATIDRRRLEAKAVQAAQEARMAEQQLELFQRSLIEARQQLAAVNAQRRILGEIEEELETGIGVLETPPGTAPVPPPLRLSPAAARRVGIEAPTVADLQSARRGVQRETAALEDQQEAAQSEITTAEARVQAASAAVQAARSREIQASEQAQAAEAKENLAYKDAFRREVAAAHADPDTYAPGVPDSPDPVEQVSVSVIGEGLLALRGPRKGVNTVRTMINEIDAPVGQVRIGLHTVQINGEHADRMEKVAMRIQRYIDHSRFLTTQSAQMLRNAVVSVASRRAEAILLECEGLSQFERDRKYQEAFFGREFLAELQAMDSEFLHTGNKLLSLHSMDTTSLASALFLLALAKNDVRMEVLAEFERLTLTQLPLDEQQYFAASGAEYKFRGKKFQFFGHNAHFTSLRGFFQAEIAGPDTLTPLQREFLRLAQIFKSRLVTEIEWRQRVMERALIEERLGNYEQELQKSRNREAKALEKFHEVQAERLQQQRKLVVAFTVLVETWTTAVDPDALTTAIVQSTLEGLSAEAKSRFADHYLPDFQDLFPPGTREVPRTLDMNGKPLDVVLQEANGKFHIFPRDPRWNDEWRRQFRQAWDDFLELKAFVESFRFEKQENIKILEREERFINDVARAIAQDEEAAASSLTVHYELAIATRKYLQLAAAIEAGVRDYEQAANRLAGRLTEPGVDVQTVYAQWLVLRDEILGRILDPQKKATFRSVATGVNEQFLALLTTEVEFQFAQQMAQASRRPLDHKKFLDMLIDDVEEKYIDLLEGTRAHTANVDNYLQRIATALEDDFNTQFYHPAFRAIRETGGYWDVELGQIEHTSILTNNRAFAKVSPQATMEFDLPKRRILIAEAFEAAEAAYQDYGALLADPNFLALTKLYSGQPTSSVFNSGAPNPMVRDILPGLPSAVDENLLIQAPGAAPEFASQLEALIPDPAIYKFETGTGFEVRPLIQPDGQAVVFHLHYLYTTNVREPVRADEKHLGRVKRHFIDTDVQLGNYELREVSRYQVKLKAARTGRGVPLLEDIPGVGALFRPLPQAESSLQENLILSQATIYPTVFDLMGLRWAPAVADLDALGLQESEFVVRSRQKVVEDRVFDYSSSQVDDFMRIPQAERRRDLYRTQQTIPGVHPNGYYGPGVGQRDSHLQEGYDPRDFRQPTPYVPNRSDTVPMHVLPQSPGTLEMLPPGQLPAPTVPLPPGHTILPGQESGSVILSDPQTSLGGERGTQRVTTWENSDVASSLAPSSAPLHFEREGLTPSPGQSRGAAASEPAGSAAIPSGERSGWWRWPRRAAPEPSDVQTDAAVQPAGYKALENRPEEERGFRLPFFSKSDQNP